MSPFHALSVNWPRISPSPLLATYVDPAGRQCSPPGKSSTRSLYAKLLRPHRTAKFTCVEPGRLVPNSLPRHLIQQVQHVLVVAAGDLFHSELAGAVGGYVGVYSSVGLGFG
ncbi:hypothetical protein CCICO_09400 [Corynebacterium ciconiae DSM 44920]|nr:hypothetical protein CCICO_09400 [Corynebacterium ciconiae DSM 44920]